MRYKHYAKITRSAGSLPDNTSSGGTDYNFDPDPATNDNSTTVYENYPCNIIESVTSYEANEQGQNYTGKSTMKGMLTDKLLEGDIVDGQYKIVGKPRIVQSRETVCNLVRIN